MGLYGQTSETDKYLVTVRGLAPQTLVESVNRYKSNRALALGLKVGVLNPNVPGGFSQLQQAKIKLADRLKAIGTDLAPMLIASGEHKAFIEAQVNAAVNSSNIGGFDKISPTGEWAFVLADLTRDSKGAITGYSLPGLPFTYYDQVDGQTEVWSIDIAIAEDGSGTYTATPLSGQAAGEPL